MKPIDYTLLFTLVLIIVYLIAAIVFKDLASALGWSTSLLYLVLFWNSDYQLRKFNGE